MKDVNFVTAEEALKHLRNGMRVFVGSGCAAPQTLVEALAARGTHVYDVEIIHILTFGAAPYASRARLENFRHNAFFIGPNVRDAVNEGLADFTPVFLSDVPALFRQKRIHLDVALIQVTRPDSHGFCSLGVSVDVVKAAIENADYVVAEVNANMPRTLGDSFVHLSQIDAMVESDAPILEFAIPPISAEAQKIGEFIASLIEDGATLQTGIGEIPSALLSMLSEKKDLGMHTEMFTEAVIPLIESGVLNCRRKTLLPGKIVSSFCFGTRKLYDYIHDNPFFEFRPTEFTNDSFQIALNEKMVSISSAIEIDLTGQVCADSIGTRFYSGFGGQLDFIRGAARSVGGKPIIALPSTTRDGKASRIAALLKPGGGVVTTRGDVHYVVTEYGVADLHGKTVRERALALIHIAHPKFRDELLRQARERRLVHPNQIALPPGLQPYPKKYEADAAFKGRLKVRLRPIWVIGPTLSLEIPIFDQGQPELARMGAEYRRAARNLEALAVNIRSEIREARDAFVAARNTAEYHEKVLLPQRQRLLRETLLQYNAMQLSTIELLHAKEREQEEEQAAIEALRDYWIARARLETALGGTASPTPAAQNQTGTKAKTEEHHHDH